MAATYPSDPNSSHLPVRCPHCGDIANECVLHGSDVPRPICDGEAVWLRHIGAPVEFRPVADIEGITTSNAVEEYLEAAPYLAEDGLA